MERRRFLVKAGGVLAVSGAAAVVDAPYVIAQPKFQWRMPTTWTPALDVMQGSAHQVAKVVEEMTGGRLRIEVFPAGQIMPALGCFDAASQGSVEAFMGASYYWAGKDPAVQWFTSVPFGMNPEGMATWYFQSDGMKLWEETYAPFNLVPRPGIATGPQMAGWFRRKINTLADYKGLRMRIPGLGGKVVAKAGSTVVLTPGGEIYSALERGVIDAAEWVGPHDDMKLGPAEHGSVLLLSGLARAGHRARIRVQQESVRGATRRRATHSGSRRDGEPGVWSRRIRSEEHHRAPQAQDRLQGQGRCHSTSGGSAAGPEEADDGRYPGRVGEEPDGEEGVRVVHEVPARSSPTGGRSPRARTISSSRYDVPSVWRKRRWSSSRCSPLSRSTPWLSRPVACIASAS